MSKSLDAPRSVLLFERIHYDWIHPELIQRLQVNFGTHFTVLTPNNATAKRRAEVLDENGEFCYIEDIEDVALKAKVQDDTFEMARAFEDKYRVNYLRDIIQQDRWVSSNFVGYASNSYFAHNASFDLDETTARVNYYFSFLERLFERRKIDYVLGWPSYSLITAVATHIAIAKGIPASFLTPGRRDFRLMWSDGPYVGPRLVSRAMEEVGPRPSPPKREPPSDTRAAIEELPKEMRFSTHFRRMYELSRDRAIWLVTDRLKGKTGKRSPYVANMRRIWSDYRMLNNLQKESEVSFAEATSRPFIFFPLPYEPEFPNTSLAKDFNDTLTFVRQTALALPAGYRLVVKEHVVGVGHRPAFFLSELKRLPNVILAENSMRGIDLVEKAAAVATLNGTAGLEAAYFGKKAILFSKNVEYAGMPHVLYVADLRDLPEILRTAVDMNSEPSPEEILASAGRHYEAIEHLTVDVSRLDVFGGGSDSRLSGEEYDKIYNRLLENFTFLKNSMAA